MIRPLTLATALAAALICAAAVVVEPYPQPQSVLVNDLAEVLPPEVEAWIAASLQGLRDETGIEVTVLTIASRADHDPSASVQAFATATFNAWGVGAQARNDGILVLVVRDDREI